MALAHYITSEVLNIPHETSFVFNIIKTKISVVLSIKTNIVKYGTKKSNSENYMYVIYIYL